VNTAKAKARIRDTIKAETKNRTEKGRKILEKKLKELNLTPSSSLMKKILPAYDASSKEELYSKIGSNIIKLDNLEKVVKKHRRNKIIRYWSLQIPKSTNKLKPNKQEVNKNTKFDYKTPYIIKDQMEEDEIPYEIAECCTPIPGDDVIGYKQPNNNKIIVHKAKCPNAIKLMSNQGKYIVRAQWKTHKYLSFLAKLSIKGIDRIGITKDITTIISNELNANIRKINIDTLEGIFEGYIELYVHNVTDLNNLILNISKIKGIDSVKRVESINS
jgi:GTP pyrophosphokinase